MERALLEVIEQSTRRRNQNIDTFFQILPLFAVTHAAVHNRYTQASKPTVIAKRGFYLCGEFARWLEHEATKLSVMTQHRQNREREGSGLSGAGLGGADEVFAGEDDRKRAQLDRCGIDKSHRLHAVHDFIGQTEMLE
jgi:hypothetical protein